LVIACLGIVTALLATLVKIGRRKGCQPRDPNLDFTAVLEDSRLWDQIKEFKVPGQNNPEFLNGVATSTYQDSGKENSPNSQWASWEEKNIPLEMRSGKSANLFQLYQTNEGRAEILKLLQQLGVNTYRLSIERSHIQPNSDQEWDEDKLQIYLTLAKFLKEHGIATMITLDHFSEPQWALSSVDSFATYGKKIIDLFSADFRGMGPLVKYYCTINEPSIRALSSYIVGLFPPGLFLRWTKGGELLKSLLQAHQKLYAIAKRPGIEIGIVHQYLPFVSSNPLMALPVRYLTRFVNEAVINTLRTGKFELKIPFACNISHDFGKFETDFVAVQTYARVVVGLWGSTSIHEPMTEMPYREDPASVYEAIVHLYRASKKPIIMTENGIAPKDNNEEQRYRYMQRALHAAAEAEKVIGIKNFKGYFLWSFTDNFEWSFGMSDSVKPTRQKKMRFGAYPVINGRILPIYKWGIQPLVDMFKAWLKKFI
jgi:beta-glucosidase